MNVNDSEKIRFLLKEKGYNESSAEEEAEIIIVNSCAVRQKAQEKVFSYIGRLARRQFVVLTGCVAQLERQKLFKKYPRIGLLVGTHQYYRIGDLLEKAASGRRDFLEFSRQWQEIVPDFSCRLSSFSAYVSVMEGCNHFCSYCVVPFTRGREKYRALANILQEAEFLNRQQVKELILLGQNVNAWRDELAGKDFADLLQELASNFNFFWIRFITSYPSLLTAKIGRVMQKNSNIARHIHLPAQSGSSRILKLMNREYTRTEYLKTVALLRKMVPGIGFSSDFIVGFPSETDRDFRLTLSLLEKVGYENIFSFVYSARSGTGALRLRDEILLKEKKKRLQILQELQEKIQLEKNRLLIGKELVVLVEARHPRKADECIARTEQGRVVNLISAEKPGALIKIRVTAAGIHSIRGQELGVIAE